MKMELRPMKAFAINKKGGHPRNSQKLEYQLVDGVIPIIADPPPLKARIWEGNLKSVKRRKA